MIRVLAVVGARLNSSRLPRKHFLELADQPLIAHLFRRLEAVPGIDRIVLATTADAYNQALVDWAREQGKHCYAHPGDVNDLVGRVDAVVAQNPAQMVLYVCGDSPLIEPQTLQRLIDALAQQPQMIGAKLAGRDGRAPIHEGFDLYSAQGWQLLVERANQPFLREHVGSSLRSDSSLAFAMAEDAPQFYEREHRLSVDTASDYLFMKTVYERWYAQNPATSLVDLTWVLDELERDPGLAGINASVKQRGASEKAPSVLIVTECGSKAGLGHLKRMMVLASGCQDALGAGVKLLIAGGGVHPQGIDLLVHRFVSPLHLLEETKAALAEQEPNIVVFDLRAETLASQDWRDWLAQKPWGDASCVAIDGCFADNSLADLALVPAFYLEQDDPLRHLPNAVFGWPYMLVEPVRSAGDDEGRDEVLILSGGSDIDGWGKQLPAWLETKCAVGTKVHWVRGPFADEPQWVAQERLSWRVSQAPDHLYPAIQQARFAICQYGVSLFECLAHGIATVVVTPSNFTKYGEVQALQEQGLALVAKDLEEAVDKLCQLQANESLAIQLGSKAKAHLDGQGGRRCALLISKQTA